MMHLYIWSDGSLSQSSIPPTQEDLVSIADGTLSIVRHDGYSTFSILDCEGEDWLTVPDCMIDKRSDNGQRIHMPGMWK